MTCAGARPGIQLRNAFVECDRLPLDAAVKVAYAAVNIPAVDEQPVSSATRKSPGNYGRALRV